jgi:hypothetical protein
MRKAAEVFAEIEKGIDPSAPKRRDTLRVVAERFFHLQGDQLRSAATYRQILARAVFDALGNRTIGTIRRSDIIQLLDVIEEERGPSAAHAALAVTRRILNWHAARSDEFRSPIIRGMGRISVKARAYSVIGAAR